jgi:hypothetical protein
MPRRNEPKEPTVSVKATVEVAEQRLRDMLTCALEGGSNYWYVINDDACIYPLGLCFDDFVEGGKMQLKDYHHPYELLPFVPGCALAIEDKHEKKMHLLDRAALLKGLEVLAQKYPRHFADMMQENDDADTGDCYLQCCLFGEMIYG